MLKKQLVNKELLNLKEELKNIRLQMKVNEEMFNLASDEYLVEAIIYDKMSLNARHGFLVSEIRKLENLNKKDINLNVLIENKI